MSNGAVDRTNEIPAVNMNMKGNGDIKYDMMSKEVLFSCLERYLRPQPQLLDHNTLNQILLRYSPQSKPRLRLQRHKQYRQNIMSNYQPLYPELYNMNPTNFFVPSFLKAITENKVESFKNIITEPSPGILCFDMLQPRFCEMLLAEVDNFEKWVQETKFKTMQPNTMNKHGAVLDDFGLETMLEKLMEDFVQPISRVFFPEVGGSTLDSHHGFVVQYGVDRDVDLGLHVDDSEVTLNVCVGKHFTGGELYFRGMRCEKHVNTRTQIQEVLDYSHVPGHAVIHRGRHRHGARATISGHRINLLLWCRSSIFRELKKYQNEFADWCGECQRLKKERQSQAVTDIKVNVVRMAGNTM